LSPFGFLPPVYVTIGKLAKVIYTGGRKPKGLNKIDILAKVTYTGGRKPKGLNKIDKGIGDLSQFVYLVEPIWFSPSDIGDLSQFVYLVEPIWISPFGTVDLSQFVYLVEPLYRREKTKWAQQDRQIG
jgi:hypothetical protein